MTPDRMHWTRSFTVWIVVIVAETVHGVLRRAYLSIRWLRVRGTRGLIHVGALWAALTVLFEVGLGRALGYDWDRIFADYDLSQGGLMGLGLLAMLMAPLLAARVRGVSASAE